MNTVCPKCKSTNIKIRKQCKNWVKKVCKNCLFEWWV